MLAFIVNQKPKKKIYRLGKGHYRFLILQLARSRSKKTKKTRPRYQSRKIVLNLESGPRLDHKIVERF